ncbi:DsbA family oxidoreductase [Pseudonocardia kunmingensis]|uniref:Putative DsbA family dithiol-disulfide isomerase n=1 Tax=Pseudonocardia kunmingensis TaxID=630975 RepID=A0A543E1P1_9PSEU|nr:DsbA family oxidoreductase [Pseudonocardia kunmingensis]TQM15492.1 putative DsbA family dithiol-disulfide isomerase [Pseudonocardia kunmingensis]
MPPLPVDIWFDLVCPWCGIGKRRFEAALAEFEHRDDVRVRWRSFELDPHAPRDATLTIPERMQQDLGLTARQAEEGAAGLTALAAELGLVYRLAAARPVNSFDAHRLLHAAAGRGLGDAVRERLMVAYTGEGAHLADHATLAALASEVGFPAADARTVLAGDDHTDAVRADEEQAARIGVTGVPTVVIAGRRITGAQPPDLLLAELGAAWRNAGRISLDRSGDLS